MVIKYKNVTYYIKYYKVVNLAIFHTTTTWRIVLVFTSYLEVASQMCKFIFLLSPRHEINEPRRNERHEGKKVLERFCSGQVYFFKIGMLPIEIVQS
jgi:hypothetical protein